MGFLSGLFSTNPTADWPPFGGKTPDLDLDRKAFGPLRFGDPLEQARAIGRPARCKADAKSGDLTLEYPTAGFRLEFEGGKLAGIFFVTAPDPEVPSERGVAPAVVRLGGFGAAEVSARTTPEDAFALFGSPESDHADEYFRDVEFLREGLYLAFSFDAGKGLGDFYAYVAG
jgi:hypothetical protein